MAIKISNSEERLLQEAVRSGLCKDTQEALSEALHLLQEKIASESGIALSETAWRKRLEQHLAHTPKTDATFVDDSRESIYEGRAE